MRRLRKRLARVCWNCAFRLEGIKPTALMNPENARRHEDLALRRLAIDLLGEDVDSPGAPNEHLPLSMIRRERIPTADDLEQRWRDK